MTRKQREKLVRDRTLPNALTGGKQKLLEDKLDKKRLAEIRELLVRGETETVVQMMRESADNVRYVAKLLNDETASVRRNASLPLDRATNSDIGIAAAIPALGNALIDISAGTNQFAALALSATVRRVAARALYNAAANNIDISSAIPELVDALRDEYADVRIYAKSALIFAARDGNEKTRGLLTEAVYEFQGSKWFAIETAKNSKRFIDLIGLLTEILQTIRDTEQREVA